MQQARELKSFGKYRLIASLGTGGMAKVYLALMAGPAGFNKLLVIKILREDLEQLFGGSADGLQMFWNEARLAARLSHPNIVQTHEVGEINGRYFIAMEYLDGQPYTAVLSRTRKLPLPIAEHLRIVSDVARALHYSHTLKSYDGESFGIVHRDVSPHNIIASYDGQVKLLDFGVATTDDPEHVTRVGVIKGKLDYIAPEQLRGDAIDGRADIFALGAVLWEALSAQRFGGGRKVSDALKVQTRLIGGERKLRDLRPALPEELVSIVECATALDPAERFADAGTFADALDAYTVSLGERPSPQSLSAALMPLFELERAQMSEVINEQLQAQKSAAAAGDLDDEAGSLPRIERESDESRISYLPDTPDDLAARAVFTRAAASIPAGVDLSTFGSHAEESAVDFGLRGADLGARTGQPRAADFGARAVDFGARAGGSRASTPAASPPRVRDMALLVVGTMTAGALLALLWPRGAPPHRDASAVVTQQDAQAPAAAPFAPAAPLAAARAPDSVAPRAASEPEVVQLQVNVEPSSASLMVDGVSVAAPFSGQFRKDSSLHMVEAAAPGFRPLKQFVKFERDQTLALALSRSSWQSRHAADTTHVDGDGLAPTSSLRSRAGELRSSGTGEATAPTPSNKLLPVRSTVPGADIEVGSAGAGADDIYQANPYRKQK